MFDTGKFILADMPYAVPSQGIIMANYGSNAHQLLAREDWILHRLNLATRGVTFASTYTAVLIKPVVSTRAGVMSLDFGTVEVERRRRQAGAV